MSVRDKVLHVLALDFAILVAIVGGWFLFVMTGPGAQFSDLIREPNLIKLSIGLVTFSVLYAQHIRTTGDFLPPDPPATPPVGGVTVGYPTPPLGAYPFASRGSIVTAPGDPSTTGTAITTSNGGGG